jgi:hypothetical protein
MVDSMGSYNIGWNEDAQFYLDLAYNETDESMFNSYM